MTVNDLGIKGKALYIFDDGRFLVYRKGHIYLYSANKMILKSVRLDITSWKANFGKIRLFERLLHIEPRFAVDIGDNSVLLQLGKHMLRIDLSSGAAVTENVSFRGRPLGYARIEGLNGFKDSVVIGDYGGNKDGGAVNVYQRTNDGCWSVAYTFSPGTMWHIHGFVVDKTNDCVYILTGDEDDQSGIWLANDNFSQVEPVVIGSQQYRTCQICVIEQKIYYFTDAPSEPNFLYAYDMRQKTVEKIASIKGTCIYGTVLPRGIVVSTTCEPEAHFDNQLYGMMTTKPGKGVESREVDLLYFDEDSGLQILKRFQHDGLPLKLFQYGTIVFSNFNNNRVLFTPISVKKYDMRVFEIVI